MAAVGWYRTARFGALCAILILAALPGCASIRVDHTHRPALLAAWRASAVLRDEVSPRTLQTLRQMDLAELYAHAPEEAAKKLHDAVLHEPQPELLFALAEIYYVRGRKTEKHDRGHAAAFYYLCAGYAYHYLFDEPPRPAPDMESNLTSVGYPSGPQPVHRVPRSSIFDPRFRLACDLYNAGLSKFIDAVQRVSQLDPRRELRLPTLDGKGLTLSVVHNGFSPWKPEEFGKLLIAADYQVVGVTNQHRTYGLGVPLIATRAPTPDKDDAARTFYPRQASFAATAFFRFEGSLADLGTQRCGRLELYNPLTIQAVEVTGQVVPLETDLTTPLAYFLANSDLGEITDIVGFVRGDRSDRIRSQTGIRMIAPYQRGKIPVVLVHGLLSSPLTWAPMINDLQADPTLRERYQFWYYYYPTGAPYLSTAAQLRRDLDELRTAVDPQHQDAALDNMVFVGHSMGGLISRLMTIDAGDDFWKLVSHGEPFDKIKLPEDARKELHRTFFFQRENCVTRCIFIATPHHGSKLSPSPLGRLAVHLVQMPSDLIKVRTDLAKDNPELAKALQKHALPTSVDLLRPDAPALKLMSSQPRPPSVHFHSIIGVVSTATTNVERWLAGDSRDPGDGVVPYTSAHLDNVPEIKVAADHFHIHHHPQSIQKVRSILVEHYQEFIRQKDARKELQLTSEAQKNAATPKP